MACRRRPSMLLITALCRQRYFMLSCILFIDYDAATSYTPLPPLLMPLLMPLLSPDFAALRCRQRNAPY